MDNKETPAPRTSLRYILSADFTFTKRQIGILLLLAGIAGFAGILAIDVLNVGREGGIGPAQKAGLALCVAMAILGATLIPLGDTPA